VTPRTKRAPAVQTEPKAAKPENATPKAAKPKNARPKAATPKAAALEAAKPKRLAYDCSRCPAYCCTYARIAVEPKDLRRLAKRFAISVEEATRRFTTSGEPGERVLRHKHDAIFGTACRFLDARTRRCTVYEDRPAVCREYPDTPRCGYWDFLTYERKAQDDQRAVVSARVELSVASGSGANGAAAETRAAAPRPDRDGRSERTRREPSGDGR
jgi:hypothetical protein